MILRRSAVGEGSEFQIAVAVDRDGAKLSPSEGKPKLTRVKTAHTGGSQIKVLLVDDSPDNRSLISAFLSKPGINVDLAENGAAGVAKALHNQYDLVLMDIQMPEMDGFEAVRVLNQKGYRVPVVALTAHAMKGDRERCLRAGFNDYLCKPVNRQSLMDMVQRYASSPPPASATLH